jgi:hypothetical protein
LLSVTKIAQTFPNIPGVKMVLFPGCVEDLEMMMCDVVPATTIAGVAFCSVEMRTNVASSMYCNTHRRWQIRKWEAKRSRTPFRSKTMQFQHQCYKFHRQGCSSHEMRQLRPRSSGPYSRRCHCGLVALYNLSAAGSDVQHPDAQCSFELSRTSSV